MATTYGERMLAEAEERTRRKRHLRRLALVFAPAALVTVLAALRTISIRADALDAGLIRTVLDAGAVLGYAGLLVLAPLWLSMTPAVRAIPATIAAVAGPMLMPVVFGPGWRWWHRGVVIVACLLVIAARRSQPDRPARRARRR